MRVRTAKSLVVDTLIALALLLVGLRRGEDSRAFGWPELDARAYLLIALAHLPVALRSRAPLAVFAVVQGAGAVHIALGYWPVVSALGPMLALYTVASVRSTRTAVGCAA